MSEGCSRITGADVEQQPGKNIDLTTEGKYIQQQLGRRVASNSLWKGNISSNNLEGSKMYFATAFERKEEVKIGHNKKQEANSQG